MVWQNINQIIIQKHNIKIFVNFFTRIKKILICIDLSNKLIDENDYLIFSLFLKENNENF